MDALESLRRRIDTVHDLDAVVRTMQALAGATLRQVDTAVEALGDYAHTVELGLSAALADVPLARPTLRERSSRQVVVQGGIIIGSEQGLCGRFNERLVTYALQTLGEGENKAAPQLAVLGVRAAAELTRRRISIDAQLSAPGSVAGITAAVQQILARVDAWRDQYTNPQVVLFGNCKSADPRMPYRSHKVTLLPVRLDQFREPATAQRSWPGRGWPSYSVPREQLLAALLQQYIFIKLFRTCAESLACEQSARLAAMQRAGNNIEEHLHSLDGDYRRRRQAAITDELLDLIGGYESLRRPSEIVG